MGAVFQQQKDKYKGDTTPYDSYDPALFSMLSRDERHCFVRFLIRKKVWDSDNRISGAEEPRMKRAAIQGTPQWLPSPNRPSLEPGG